MPASAGRSDELPGGDQWGIGPTGVVFRQQGPWTCGMLANHIASFAGDDDRADSNATLLQPCLTHTTAAGWAFTAPTETTCDWQGEP